MEGKKKRGHLRGPPDDLLPAAVKKFVKEILADVRSQKVASEISSFGGEGNDISKNWYF